MFRITLSTLAAVAVVTITTSTSFAKPPIVGYVSIGGEKQIAIYHMNPKTGALKEQSRVTVGGAPGSLALHPSKKYMYAAIRSTGSVATFAVDPKTGGLKQLAATKVVTNPVYIAVDKTGKYLLTAYYGAANVAVYPILDDGRVDSASTSVLSTGKNPHSILIDKANKHVYVPNTGADQILQFAFNESNSKLKPLKPAVVKTAKGTGPRHFYFHPSKPFAYACNEKASSVTAFAISKSGTLKAIHTVTTLPSDFKGRNSNADIEITPNGRFLYASNRGHDSLAMYAIDQKTGRIKPLGQAKTEKTPREFNIDPTGRFVYSAGQRSGRMISYAIQKDGTLKPLKTYKVGRGPAWVLFAELPSK